MQRDLLKKYDQLLQCASYLGKSPLAPRSRFDVEMSLRDPHSIFLRSVQNEILKSENLRLMRLQLFRDLLSKARLRKAQIKAWLKRAHRFIDRYRASAALFNDDIDALLQKYQQLIEELQVNQLAQRLTYQKIANLSDTIGQSMRAVAAAALGDLASQQESIADSLTAALGDASSANLATEHLLNSSNVVSDQIANIQAEFTPLDKVMNAVEQSYGAIAENDSQTLQSANKSAPAPVFEPSPITQFDGKQLVHKVLLHHDLAIITALRRHFESCPHDEVTSRAQQLALSVYKSVIKPKLDKFHCEPDQDLQEILSHGENLNELFKRNHQLIQHLAELQIPANQCIVDTDFQFDPDLPQKHCGLSI